MPRLFFVSFLVGIGVTIFAYFLFKESLTQVKPDDQVNNYANLVCEMWEVIRYRWFSFGPKSYLHITCGCCAYGSCLFDRIHKLGYDDSGRGKR